jgi:hypothetical protein
LASQPQPFRYGDDKQLGAKLGPDDLTAQDWFNRINALFYVPTRASWQDKLVRPYGTDPNQRQAHFSRFWTPRNLLLDTLWSYFVGDPPLPMVAAEYRETFRDVMRKARSNYAPMCIGAMRDRMELQAVATQDDGDRDGDEMAADVMDETGFVAVLKEVFDYTLALGEGYAMVVPGSGDGAVLSNGQPAPSIHAIDPRRCIGVPDWQNPTRLQAAVVHQYDPITWRYTAFLFLPGEKYTVEYDRGAGVWNLDPDSYEPVKDLDELGGIPLIRFENVNGMGEYEPHIDLLDRINDTTLQRIALGWYQAFRQRAIIGSEDEDQDTPDEAPEVDWDNVFRSDPGVLWRVPKDFTFWESTPLDLTPIINAKRDDVKEFAAVTTTPLHLITPDAANGSAEGAGLMREGLTSKVRDRRSRFTPPLKLLWRIVFATANADKGSRMRLHWGPIEYYTLAEKGSASAQAVGTLSVEDRCDRIWQMTPDDTQRNIQRLTADQLMNLPASPPPTVQTAPPEEPEAQPVNNDNADNAA